MRTQEWIVDSVPLSGCFLGEVWIIRPDGNVDRQHWSQVRQGTPWQHVSVPSPTTKWVPNDGERFFYVSKEMRVEASHARPGASDNIIRVGNCFKTRSEAAQVAQYFTQFFEEYHAE